MCRCPGAGKACNSPLCKQQKCKCNHLECMLHSDTQKCKRNATRPLHTVTSSRARRTMWLEASLRETVGLGPGRAWELVECHLTHHLAREAQRSHPSLQIVAEDAGSALALADQTAHRLLGQHSASEGAWRSSVAQVALACIAATSTPSPAAGGRHGSSEPLRTV